MSGPPLVLVEFDLFDGSQTQTLRVVSPVAVNGVPGAYFPVLMTPMQLGTRISGEQYGTPLRAAPNGGTIQFALNESIWPYLGYRWNGRTFRVYSGTEGDAYTSLTLIYVGRVDYLTHDTLKVTVRTTDASADLNLPLVQELYGVVLGDESSGTTLTSAPGANVMFMRKFSADIDCSLSHITIIPQVDSDTAKFRPVAYADNNGVPGILLDAGAEVVGCTGGVHLTAALAVPISISKQVNYWIGFLTDTSLVIAEFDGVLNDGVKATVTYSSGPPVVAPAMTTGQPSWEIYGSNVNAAVLSTDITATAPSSIIGVPKPFARGIVKSIAPLLIDQQNLIYQCADVAISVDDLRVGGKSWDFVASDPAQGQWTEGPNIGQITLGAVTLGSDIRVDLRTNDWELTTASYLIRQIAALSGLSVDETAMTALDATAGGLIGYFADQPVNRLDVLDQIAQGVGGWWGVDMLGNVTAGVIDVPAATADLTLTEGGPEPSYGTIATLQLSRVIPPVWRLRVEYARNWSPESSFLDTVSESEQAVLGATGIIAPAFKDYTIKSAEPIGVAVDLAVIRSLFVAEDDAIKMRDRLAGAWSVTRSLYDGTAWIDASDIVLYDTASVAYMMVSGSYRCHSGIRSIGGGAQQLQVWG